MQIQRAFKIDSYLEHGLPESHLGARSNRRPRVIADERDKLNGAKHSPAFLCLGGPFGLKSEFSDFTLRVMTLKLQEKNFHCHI